MNKYRQLHNHTPPRNAVVMSPCHAAQCQVGALFRSPCSAALQFLVTRIIPQATLLDS